MAPAAPAPQKAARFLLVLLFLLAGAAPAAARTTRIEGKGRWKRFDVKTVGQVERFAVEMISGCRYRLTVDRGTLRIPVIEMGWPAAEPEVSVEIPPGDALIVHEWEAERTRTLELRVEGFSALTGKGRLKVETLGPDGEPTKAHRRFLDPRMQKPRIGELLVGEDDPWELILEPDKRYEIRPTPGTAGVVRLMIEDPEGRLIADSNAWRQEGVPFAHVRFLAPAEPVRLVVSALWSHGGTYGVRLRELGEHDPVTPEGVVPPREIERGQDAEDPAIFRLNGGDLAVLWTPPGAMPPQPPIFERLRGKWMMLDPHGGHTRGTEARGRADGYGNVTAFRPYLAGEFRFGMGGGLPPGARLQVFAREDLGPAPVHIGTAKDPTARAAIGGRWTTIGLGICFPDMTYLFVASGAPTSGVALRVRSLDGERIASRSSRGAGLGFVSGHGPSLRFSVKTPQIVRLEAKGSRRVCAALLRQLMNR